MASKMVVGPLSRAEAKKVKSRGSPPICENIAAIDFGTTSLTLSYITKGGDKVITMSFGSRHSECRIPNSILLRHQGNGKYDFIALGNGARQAFSKSRDRTGYIYFERIKMLMKQTDKDICREAHVTSFTGEVFYLIEVIAFILKQVALHLQDHLPGPIPIKKSQFNWVITVPAIWDARGKRFMREAAYMSGMLTDEEGITTLTPVGSGISRPMETNPEKLSLALEPECAAIYSQYESKDEIKNYHSTLSKAEAKKARKLSDGYMVIDIGGGTIDIAVQEEVKGRIKAVAAPAGMPIGGTKINEKFSSIFQKIVGDEKFARFLKSGNYTTNKVICENFLYQEFESQKTTFGQGMKKGQELGIVVPKEMVLFYQETTISNNIKSMPGYSFEDGTIWITQEAAYDTLFKDFIETIKECTLKTLASYDVGIIYLAGGFGSCNLIKQHVEKALTDGQLTIVPTDPILAIATGAVWWRRNPEVIKSRFSEATYGIAIQLPFDKKKHNPIYKVRNESNGKDYCKDILEVFLLKGENVNADDVFVSSLHVPSDEAEVVTLVIYSTESENVQYINSPAGDPIAQPIGQLIIDAPNPNKLPLKKRRIEVTISFSGTEITAKAKYELTGIEVKTVCDFLSAVVVD